MADRITVRKTPESVYKRTGLRYEICRNGVSSSRWRTKADALRVARKILDGRK